MTDAKNKKKRILITTDTFSPKRDGVTRFLDILVPELSHKYHITILAPSYSSKKCIERFHGADVIRLPVSGVFSLEEYPAVKATPGRVKKYVEDADLVWVNSAAPLGASAILAAKKLGKPAIAYIHSLEWEQLTHIVIKNKILKKLLIFFVSRFGKYLYSKCDLLMVSSKSVADEINKKGIKTKKVIIPLGVDCEKFSPADREKAKKAIGIDPKKIVIGYCGRISKEKDIPTLAKAFRRLQHNYLDLFLLIIGDGRKEDITEFVKKNYRITGFVGNAEKYLQALDIFVLSSLTETTSLATLEAMSCGVAPIATKVGCTQEYIENGFNGFIFPKENVDMLCAKIERLVRDPSLREKMGSLARKTVTTKHTWEKTIVRIDKVLEKY